MYPCLVSGFGAYNLVTLFRSVPSYAIVARHCSFPSFGSPCALPCPAPCCPALPCPVLPCPAALPCPSTV